MEDVIIIAVLLCIIGGIVFYLSRAKKRGETCIGCPYSRQCGSKGSACECGGAAGNTGKNSWFQILWSKGIFWKNKMWFSVANLTRLCYTVFMSV